MILNEDVTNPEAKKMCMQLKKKHYISHITYISKEQALKEQTQAMGTNPSEFLGSNPFLGSIELQLFSDYANNDSLKWIERQLKSDSRVSEITYPRDLMDSVNRNLQKINFITNRKAAWNINPALVAVFFKFNRMNLMAYTAGIIFFMKTD